MKTLSVYDTQQLTLIGVKVAIMNTDDFTVLCAFSTMILMECQARPDIILVDKQFGLEWLNNIDCSKTAVIIWSNFFTEHEIVTMNQFGVRGVLSKTCSAEKLLECLRAVAEGKNWIDPSFSQPQWTNEYLRSELTPREQQVLKLVEQGMKNKEIAEELNISPGTVKIHLRHILKKTGTTSRVQLRLSYLRNKYDH